MKTIHITFAEKPSATHPLAVRLDDGQEAGNRSMRDCRIYANGMQAGLDAAGIRGSAIVIDPRLLEVVS